MAKIPFSKLNLKVNTEVATIPYGDYSIEVRKYLPMEEKANMVSDVLNWSVDENDFYNPMRVKVFLTLATVYTYTNLSFTAKMKEDGLKLYDILVSSGLFDKIVECIPADEWEDLQKTVWQTIANIYEYKNSIMGVLDTIQTDYNNLNFDLETLKNNINDPNSLTLLKEILNYSGLKE